MKRLLFSYLLAAALNAQTEPHVELGFEQRVRNEDWNNIFDWNQKTDDQRVQIRYRSRLWTTIPVHQNVEVAVGLAQETNQIVVTRTPWKFDEIAFERAYVDFKRLFVNGLSLKVGRQDLIRGEGSFLLEGNPYDGSRSIYVNAAVLGYQRGKTKVELIGIDDPSRDRFLPRFHDQHRLLQEWDQRAIGYYITHKPRKDTDLETYYFLQKSVHDTRPATNPQFQPDRHLHAFGARGVRRFTGGWTAQGEAVVERGADHAGRNLSGWAANGYLKHVFEKRTGTPSVQAGYWAFSGGWDPLFGRWPKWSEGYIYSQFREQGVAIWTNLRMSQLEATFKPAKPLLARVTWYHMDAMHPFAGNPAIFGTGTGRGEEFQARVDYAASKHWKAHVLWEYHVPGSFYRAQDAGYFLRFEASYLLLHRFSI